MGVVTFPKEGRDELNGLLKCLRMHIMNIRININLFLMIISNYKSLHLFCSTLTQFVQKPAFYAGF